MSVSTGTLQGKRHLKLWPIVAAFLVATGLVLYLTLVRGGDARPTTFNPARPVIVTQISGGPSQVRHGGLKPSVDTPSPEARIVIGGDGPTRMRPVP
jgi:hypothetical protein